MNNKIIFLISLLFFQQILLGQTKETCESPAEESVLELNSITKCTIEEATNDLTKKKEVKIQVSSRRRVVRKKQVAKGIGASSSNNVKLENVSNDATLTNLEKQPSKSDILAVNKESVIEKVPFNHVDQIPLMNSCEKASLLEQKKCFNKFISNHVRKNLKYPSEAREKSIQGRVLTQFVIDLNGNITDINLRGPYQGELLEEEAKRIINTLPKFKPGKHHGKTVKVKYGIPISFKIPGKEPSNVRTNKALDFNNVLSFDKVDQIPAFKDCRNKKTEKCFNSELIKHINENFIYPEKALRDGVQGKVLIYFIIDKNGNITNTKTRAPKGCEILEKETKDLFNKLPKFIPANHNGNAIDVKHVFPIDYTIN